MTKSTSRLRRSSIAALTGGLLLMIAPSAHAKEPLVAESYGPEPDWARYKELAEEALRAKLIDPDSAKFTWPHGYVKRGYTPFLSHRIYGYATCGFVNSRNRMGGFAGNSYFTVVIDNDQVLYAEIDESRGVSLMGEACRKAGFPDPPSETAQASPAAFGLELKAMPDGAYIEDVSDGSGGDKAGLKSGMVIARVNGISIRGMSASAVEQLLAGADGAVSLELIGGTTVKVAQP